MCLSVLCTRASQKASNIRWPMRHHVGRSNIRSSSQAAIYIAYFDPKCDQHIGELKVSRNGLAPGELDENNVLYEAKPNTLHTSCSAEPHVLLGQLLHNVGELCAPRR